MFSYLTTLLGTNVNGLSLSKSVLEAPFATFPGPVIDHVSVGDNVTYDRIPNGDLKGRRLAVQGHRGAQGMRTEASLYAFAYSMELGVDTLEMDLLFTKDKIPIIWHDHHLTPEKCVGEYVGATIVDLTLEQVKSMDCGLQLVDHPTQQVHPLTRIATLEEVLDFITCYSDNEIFINIETKLDPRVPHETYPPSLYATDIIPTIERKGFANRTLIQSFDFRTLFLFRDMWPQYPLVALTDPVTIAQDEDGSYPWLGGIQLDSSEYNHDWVLASYATGARIVGPWDGNGTSISSPDWVPFTTKEIVDRAHGLGMEVHPWTVDGVDTINAMIEWGVDEIVSNYPERVIEIAKRRGMSLGRRGRDREMGIVEEDKWRAKREKCLVNIDWVGPVGQQDEDKKSEL